ncbi:hypothetical protein AX16_010730 [Volvariella volvacea WC 439]|nr:hypothetical protein AX16_010730 [Volvariella volvacea WC 439]
MFSTPAPASGRNLVNATLRNAGLMDRDTHMRDATDKPGGRKGPFKPRRPRTVEGARDDAGGPSRSTLSTRASTSHATAHDPLSIRGAARPTAVGRLRRNAGGSSSNMDTPVVRAPPKTIEHWRQIVQSRWNPQLRYLNLESLADHEIVRRHNLSSPGLGGGSAKEAAVLFKLASQLQPEVQSLSLANNGLKGEHLAYLHRYLPRLVNLSLQNNSIQVWKDLEYISSRRDKMLNLRELILIGNPIRELEYQHGRGESYRQEVARRMSSLEVLDQEAIAQISFDVQTTVPTVPTAALSTLKKPSPTTFPYEMGPSFVTGVDGSLVGNFLVRFFELFDTQRAGLLDAYDSAATFSYTVNTSIPKRARIEGLHSSKNLPNQRKLDWNPWLQGGEGGSRNLVRLSGLDRTVKSLHIGATEVVKAMASLPGTRHDIAGPPELFSVDAFPVIQGENMSLLLTIHGQFTEVGVEGIRSFDRSFILIPAPPESQAKRNGWDVVILSDQWTIRSLSNPDAWKPGPMLVQAQAQQAQGKHHQPQQQPQQQNVVPPQQTGIVLPPDQQAEVARLVSFVVGFCAAFSMGGCR